MKYAYYPGCSLHSTGIEYHLSTRLVAQKLNVELWEIPGWNCCGASAAHNINHLLSLALPARNLALAEQEGLDVAVPCAACFNRMKATEAAVRESSATKETIAGIIDLDYQATNNARALLDILVNEVGTQTIAKNVSKPLQGLKVACYYGCLLVRPPQITGFDDPENPQTMDQLVSSLGGEPVNWAYKTECCSAGHTTTRSDIGLPVINSILKNAKANGAECILSACPLCFLNLDMRQPEIEQTFKTSYGLPVFYFTELMGFAMGFAPSELGMPKHFVNPVPLLRQKTEQAAVRRDEA
jgi:heterodisulfide reductase subunit B